MGKIIVLAVFICFCGLSGVFAQTKNKKVSIPVVKLNRVHRAANFGSADEYKVVNITLLGFRNAPDDWVYVFHLKD